MILQGQRERKPVFWWQGLLILLPVLVLAVMGALSLQRDRAAAAHDAGERAQGIAEELLPRLWTMLEKAGTPATVAFEVDRAGQLTFPLPVSETPVPQALDPAQLTPLQRRWWTTAMVGQSQTDLIYTNLLQFMSLDPPPRFAANATYHLALLSVARGEFDRGAALLQRLLRQYPEATAESGLRLQPLARFKLLELQGRLGNQPTNLDAAAYSVFCSNVVSEPSPLTPLLLDKALGLASSDADRTELGRWRTTWAEQEAARQLFEQVRAQSPELAAAPLLFGLGAHEPDHAAASPPQIGSPSPLLTYYDWWVMRTNDAAGNTWFLGRTEQQLGATFLATIKETRSLPDYFGIRIRLAGKPLAWQERSLNHWREEPYFGRRGGGLKKQVLDELATQVLASAEKRVAGAEVLAVQVLLTSPEVLYKHQSARTFWFGALLCSAAVAASIGLLSAWRAFHRQQQLADLKTNFVSSVSHELRAPIASVRLLAESLDGGKVSDPAKQREYFKFIVQECRRLSALIENVLDFSRIERGRKLYEFEPTDLLALVQTTVRLMEPNAAERGLTLALALPSPDAPGPQPTVDGKAIQQALVNLIDNAIKHSHKGQTITIGLEAEPQPAAPGASATGFALLALWVEDHGEGIPADQHEKIFERFYRLGSELRRETQGVGIGLSIVKHIVEAHGGGVRVRSAPGQGSRFTIELPWNASS